jgi:hypothetical protein
VSNANKKTGSVPFKQPFTVVAFVVAFCLHSFDSHSLLGSLRLSLPAYVLGDGFSFSHKCRRENRSNNSMVGGGACPFDWFHETPFKLLNEIGKFKFIPFILICFNCFFIFFVFHFSQRCWRLFLNEQTICFWLLLFLLLSIFHNGCETGRRCCLFRVNGYDNEKV